MKTRKRFMSLGLLLIACSACGRGEPVTGGDNSPAEEKPPAVTTEPVTLNLLFSSSLGSFEQNWADPLRKKYPNFELKHVQMSPDEAIATNTPIDILFNSITVSGQYVDRQLTTDMSELVKKYKVDTGRFYPELLDALRMADRGKLIGFPHRSINLVLFYNKDLFDKFGVAYPRDGMTWEETQELARLLTRSDGGVQYYGFTGSLGRMLGQNQYALPLIQDGTTKTTYVSNDRWQRMFNTFAPLFTMSGYNADAALLADAKQLKLFREEHLAAMHISDHSNRPSAAHSETMNWDMVTAPDFSDKKGAGPVSVFTFLALSSNSKHPDEAFLAIDWLTSEEVQARNAKEMLYVPVVRNPEVRTTFAEGDTLLKTKNLKPLFPEKYADPLLFHTFYSTARTPLVNSLIKVITGEKDVNTALREAGEAADRAVEAAVAASQAAEKK